MTTTVTIADGGAPIENTDPRFEDEFPIRMFNFLFNPSTMRHVDDESSESDSDTDDDNLPDQFFDVIGTVTGPYVVEEYEHWRARVDTVENPDPLCARASRILSRLQDAISFPAQLRDITVDGEVSGEPNEEEEFDDIGDDDTHEPYHEALETTIAEHMTYETDSREHTGELTDEPAF